MLAPPAQSAEAGASVRLQSVLLQMALPYDADGRTYGTMSISSTHGTMCWDVSWGYVWLSTAPSCPGYNRAKHRRV